MGNILNQQITLGDYILFESLKIMYDSKPYDKGIPHSWSEYFFPKKRIPNTNVIRDIIRDFKLLNAKEFIDKNYNNNEISGIINPSVYTRYPGDYNDIIIYKSNFPSVFVVDRKTHVKYAYTDMILNGIGRNIEYSWKEFN